MTKKPKLPNYLDIGIPMVKKGEEEKYKDFNYNHRRAAIARLILDTGHPRMVNQTALARKFDVTQQMISKDFLAVMPQIVSVMKKEGETVIHAVMNKVMKDCMNGDLKARVNAARIAKNYHDMLLDSGEIEKAPDKIETSETKWSDIYAQIQEEENGAGKKDK